MTYLTMVTRRKGEVGKILLNEGDVKILLVLEANKDKFSVLSLKDKLKLSNLSGRRHIQRLVDSKFITKEKVEGKNKFLLNITHLGKDVLKIFSRFVK